jgi:hypothetical protein
MDIYKTFLRGRRSVYYYLNEFDIVIGSRFCVYQYDGRGTTTLLHFTGLEN